MMQLERQSGPDKEGDMEWERGNREPLFQKKTHAQIVETHLLPAGDDGMQQ
jgi:hypothetical protein